MSTSGFVASHDQSEYWPAVTKKHSLYHQCKLQSMRILMLQLLDNRVRRPWSSGGFQPDCRSGCLTGQSKRDAKAMLGHWLNCWGEAPSKAGRLRQPCHCRAPIKQNQLPQVLNQPAAHRRVTQRSAASRPHRALRAGRSVRVARMGCGSSVPVAGAVDEGHAKAPVKPKGEPC